MLSVHSVAVEKRENSNLLQMIGEVKFTLFSGGGTHVPTIILYF